MPIGRRFSMMQQASAPKLALYGVGEPDRHNFDDRLFAQNPPEYVTYSSLEAAPLARLVGRTDVPPDAQAAGQQYKAFLDALQAKYQEVQQFGEPGESVEDMQYIQPIIHVWKIK